MRKELLKDIAEIIAGQSPPSDTYNKTGEGVPFFQGMADYGDKFPVVRKWCRQPAKISLPNDILISVRAPVGPVNINNVEACIGRGLSAIRAKENYSYEYLYYFLKANEKQISNLGVGSTFTAITQKELGKINISIPETLAEQIKIAFVLNTAEALIKQRQENIDLLSEFLRSSFLKMFGDPDKNDKGWEKKKLGDVINSIRYGTSTPPEYQKKGNPFIRATNIKNGRITKKGMVYISDDEAGKIEKCKVSTGDLIIVRSGVNTGDAAIIPKEYDNAYAGYDLILTLNPITSIFYNELINSNYGKAKIKPLTQRSGQPHLNAEQVKNLEFYFPPLELQKEFVSAVEKIEALKEQFKNSLNDLENLYGSLSQKAFKGELEIDTAKVIDSIDTDLAAMEYGGSIGAEGLYNSADEREAKLWKKELEEHKREFELKQNLIKILEGSTSFIERKFEKEKIKKPEPKDKTIILSGKPVFVPEEKPIEKKKEKKSKITWEKVSTEQAANWIKENYTGFHFTSEMLVRFLMDEHVTFPDYHSSEDLKKKPQLNEADDLKNLIHSAIVIDKDNKEEFEEANRYIKLEQLFYNAEKENFQLNLTEDDYELIKDRSPKERSGIYFSIIE